MQVKLPYVFHVTGKPPGKRNLDRVVVGDWKVFDIPEVSVLEAPVCMVFDRLEQYNFFDTYGAEGHAEVRFHDGRFYRSKMEPDGRPFSSEGLAGRVLVDYSPFDEKLMSAQILFAQGVERRPRPSFQGETWSDETEILAALEARAGGLLVVEGAVWEACPEPVLIVEETLGGRYRDLTVSPGFLDVYEPDKRSKHYVFAIDQIDEANAFCEARRVHTGYDDIEIRIAGEIDVRAPELVSRDQLGDDVVRHAAEFVEETGTPSLNRVSAAYSGAWTRFAEAMRVARYSRSDEDMERLLDAWLEFAEERSESYLPTLTSKQTEAMADTGDYCLHMVRSLITRFEDRPLRLDADLAAPSPR